MIQAQVLYPSLAPQPQMFGADRELQTACVRAYNDWIHEFASTAPDRLVAMPMAPDDRSRRHARGVAARRRAGRPWLRDQRLPERRRRPDRRRRPLLVRGERLGLRRPHPLRLHERRRAQRAERRRLPHVGRADRHGDRRCTARSPTSCTAVCSSGIRGCGSSRSRRASDGSRTSATTSTTTSFVAGSGPASALAGCRASTSGTTCGRRSSRTRYGIRNRHEIGVDRIMWSTDYPHTNSNWPNSQRIAAYELRDVPARRAAPDRARQRGRASTGSSVDS